MQPGSAMPEESELRVVIGDLSPLPETLGLLRRFFDLCPRTRLHLHFEALAGPWERLFDGEADLIIHHIDKADPRLEFIDLMEVRLLPVVAPGFLDFPITDTITFERMRNHAQCIIRDTARHSPQRDYYVIDGARSWTVKQQLMKKELILQGMGWGHMPTFLVDEELRDGRLVSIAGRHLRGGEGDLVAARRRDTPHGSVAQRLWRCSRSRRRSSARHSTRKLVRGHKAPAETLSTRRGTQTAIARRYCGTRSDDRRAASAETANTLAGIKWPPSRARAAPIQRAAI